MQSENEKTARHAHERAHLARQIGRLLAQELLRNRALMRCDWQLARPVANVSEDESAKLS